MHWDDVKGSLYPDTADVEDFSYERGGGSTRSVQWAGAHGMNFLTSNVVKAEDSTDFAEIQAAHIRAFRDAAPESARVSQGLVVIPTDSATAEQRAKYAAYAQSREARIGIP